MNKTLLAGLLILAAMLTAALLGPSFAPHDLKEQLKITYFINDQGKGEIIVPPVSPNGIYPFGTDKNGYDLLTKLLHGAKYTLFLSFGIAFARVMFGGIIGMFLGYNGKKTVNRSSGLSVWKMLNGIPIFLIVWFMMIGITMNPTASPIFMSVIMAVVLTVVGVPSVASTIKDKTMIIRERLFVLAAESLGAGHWRILRSHLFPHLKESLLILIVHEVILILTLFGQLAIFNIFVGGTIMNFDPAEYFSRSNEWGGLIGQAKNGLYVHKWILLIPLAAYTTLIIGFHFISKGLEAHYQKKYAKFSHI
jgi:peptide/nickel transport system permease protein